MSEIIEAKDIGKARVLAPTMELKWIMIDVPFIGGGNVAYLRNEKVLHQKWVDTTEDYSEWREIPIEE